MENPLIKRKNRQFCIDEFQIPQEHRRVDVINSLYAAMFQEFSGAIKNTKYKNMTNQQKMDSINQFAEDWLKKRNYL